MDQLENKIRLKFNGALFDADGNDITREVVQIIKNLNTEIRKRERSVIQKAIDELFRQM